jgi:hypothetical protein
VLSFEINGVNEAAMVNTFVTEAAMVNTFKASIVFALRDNGRVIAASTTSPYFCFEAADKEAAKRKVEDAIAFYIDAKRELRQRRSRETKGI